MKETEKMLDIIHKNCKAKQIEREEEIAKKENKKNRNKKEIVILIIILAIVLGLIGIFNRHNLQSCMDQGGSYEFCRYAGE